MTATAGIRNNLGITMTSQKSPRSQIFTLKAALNEEWRRRPIRIFNHRKIIDQDFSFLQQTKDKLTPSNYRSESAGFSSASRGRRVFW